MARRHGRSSQAGLIQIKFRRVGAAGWHDWQLMYVFLQKTVASSMTRPARRKGKDLVWASIWLPIQLARSEGLTFQSQTNAVKLYLYFNSVRVRSFLNGAPFQTRSERERLPACVTTVSNDVSGWFGR